MKYFRKDIIKVQVVGSLYKHRILHGKMKIILQFLFSFPLNMGQVMFWAACLFRRMYCACIISIKRGNW